MEEVFIPAWRRMIEEQLIERGIRSERVLEAMETVPRHAFILPEYRIHAYDDGPLPIGNGQTISQPYIVALMSELLELRGDERVLEVGTGSGYQAAVLSHLAREVHTIERHGDLTHYAERILRDLGVTNVYFHVGDGSVGWPEQAPYGGIIVTAAAPDVPKALLEQLADGGRLVIPIGNRSRQELEVWTRMGARYEFDTIIPVAFVPLLGEKGWKDENQFGV